VFTAVALARVLWRDVVGGVAQLVVVDGVVPFPDDCSVQSVEDPDDDPTLQHVGGGVSVAVGFDGGVSFGAFCWICPWMSFLMILSQVTPLTPTVRDQSAIL
jgi:hypothetical protein